MNCTHEYFHKFLIKTMKMTTQAITLTKLTMREVSRSGSDNKQEAKVNTTNTYYNNIPTTLDFRRGYSKREIELLLLIKNNIHLIYTFAWIIRQSDDLRDVKGAVVLTFMNPFLAKCFPLMSTFFLQLTSLVIIQFVYMIHNDFLYKLENLYPLPHIKQTLETPLTLTPQKTDWTVHIVNPSYPLN